eukprot:366268-Chlamydomonas_euryale.AAC.21
MLPVGGSASHSAAARARTVSKSSHLNPGTGPLSYTTFNKFSSSATSPVSFGYTVGTPFTRLMAMTPGSENFPASVAGCFMTSTALPFVVTKWHSFVANDMQPAAHAVHHVLGAVAGRLNRRRYGRHDVDADAVALQHPAALDDLVPALVGRAAKHAVRRLERHEHCLNRVPRVGPQHHVAALADLLGRDRWQHAGQRLRVVVAVHHDRKHAGAELLDHVLDRLLLGVPRRHHAVLGSRHAHANGPAAVELKLRVRAAADDALLDRRAATEAKVVKAGLNSRVVLTLDNRLLKRRLHDVARPPAQRSNRSGVPAGQQADAAHVVHAP